MKRFFSMLAILGLIAVSNCSRIPENNDPILGIWVKAEITNEDTARTNSSTPSEKWIFNDVYLGRYQRYSGNEIIFYTDFRWEVIDNVYTINYSDDEIPAVQVALKKESLELQNGDVFATRQ